MRRVLVIRFSSLGDIIMTLPSLDHLIDSGHEVHILTKSSFRPLLETFRPELRIHVISDHARLSELVAKVRELRALGFERVYDLHRNLRSLIAILCLKVAFKRVSKHRLKEVFLYLFRRGTFRAMGLRSLDRAQHAMRLVGGGGIVGRERLRRLPALPASAVEWRGRLGPKGYVCVAMESKWAQKEWAASKFVDVARRARSLGLGVVWIGVRALPPEAKALDGSLDLTGKLSIGEVGAVLRGARSLVCNDSGLMHLAEAVGVPVVAIFGPTSRELGFAPRLADSRLVESDLWCRPCSKTGRLCFRPIERRKCLAEVQVEEVMQALEAVLSTKERRT